ncbi:MAG TPA: ABC transporter substrate-binding protein [Candidatus Binataceae bacterium]|nr:ABC transporter substrate-binding protein [Candidatus Binataceae bacterium]
MRKSLISRYAPGRTFIAAACAVLLVSAIASTASAADDPMTVVKTTVDQALTVLRDKQTPIAQRQQKLRDIVSATFDFQAMSRSAMGYYWKQITPDQQQEFQKVFITFIENSYLAKINEFVSGEVKYLNAQPNGNQFSMVKTSVVMPNTGPIALDFRLLNLNGQWQIYDVLVDGISILANYRNQFNRIMSSKGYDTLIRDLKSKEASLAASMGT